MKKIFFGALLLMCGIIGMMVFISLSVIHPWSYNSYTGLLGFLLGTKMFWVFALFCIMSIIGIAICFYEAYVRK